MQGKLYFISYQLISRPTANITRIIVSKNKKLQLLKVNYYNRRVQVRVLTCCRKRYVKNSYYNIIAYLQLLL